MILTRLDLVKHLIIKISERSLTQRFDDSMSSLSSVQVEECDQFCCLDLIVVFSLRQLTFDL